MPITQVGAIYATGSRLLQRIYIPHADDSEIEQQHVASGETLRRVPLALFRDGGPPALQALIGAPMFSGRCALVHKTSKVVIDVIIADPALYADPDGHLVIADDQAIHGDVWTGTEFRRAPSPVR
jgi:hypothetical protein